MKKTSKQTIKIYWKHLRPYRLHLFFAIFLIVIGSIANNFAPIFFAKFFNTLSKNEATPETIQRLFSLLFIIGFILIFRWACARISGYITNIFIPKIKESDLYITCFTYLHKHSFGFFSSNFAGTLVKRTHRFTRAFSTIFDNLMWYIIGLIVDVGVVFVVLTEKNVWLGTAILVWTIFFLTLNWFLTNFKLKYDIKYNVVDSQTSGLYADTVTNNVNVKLFNGYKNELAKLKKLSEKVGKLLKLKWDLENTFEGIQGFMMIVLEIGMLYLAIKLWKKGLISAGDFILIESYILTICNQVWGFGRTIRYTYEALADAEEMTTILNTPHEIKDIANAKKLEITKGKIEFKNVYFYYHKKRKIFSNLSFNINAKEKIAFVGPSGSGKSTIIKLLLRMYDLPKGQILIDDQNISNVTQESLWENVSLVPQDPILFHRSLLDNIRYAKPRASEREIRDAARLAHCDEFINDFPEKYRTYVGERGVKLSGGERQRVAIARAILRNAPILILDEATSSLDSESESLIQDALSNLMKNKTVIVVAHRLSTIMKMDRIIVLRQGKIVEEGSHLELLKKPEGLYAKLWKFQAGGFIN